jgi:quercetin dioxygenase-like cupin family protein
MEKTISTAVPGCLGTYVELIGDRPGFQVLRVSVENGGEIPLHAHDCAATMVILEGTARTLGKDGRIVRPGDVVIKAGREPHGFTDAEGGFAFLSISTGNGIFQSGEWDLTYL